MLKAFIMYPIHINRQHQFHCHPELPASKLLLTVGHWKNINDKSIFPCISCTKPMQTTLLRLVPPSANPLNV